MKHRYWLHLLLLVLTLVSTLVVGAGLAASFDNNRPFDFEGELTGYVRMWSDPGMLLAGMPFAFTLLSILLVHEFGHFLTARYYRVDASLPYFIPAPPAIGTFGAFIRIRSAILSKRCLFDIGISGPLAGFLTLIWPLAVGVSMSKVVPGLAAKGDLVFGTPLVLRLFEMIAFPGVPASDIALHPMARGAWVGLLATALNLLPIGQLDGGHILYAFLGERTKPLSWVFAAALVPLGLFFAYSWLGWAAFLILFGMRHPMVVDGSPLGPARSWLGLAALMILVLCFTASPIMTPAG